MESQEQSSGRRGERIEEEEKGEKNEEVYDEEEEKKQITIEKKERKINDRWISMIRSEKILKYIHE